MPTTRSHKGSGIVRGKGTNAKRPLPSSLDNTTIIKKTKYGATRMVSRDDVDLLTPVKTQPVNPKKVLEGLNTPTTPAVTRAMLNANRSSTKPKRDSHALQLVDLKALKLDPKSYNSYLYVGNMTIPGSSVIAAQDHFSATKTSFYVPILQNPDAKSLLRHQNTAKNRTAGKHIPSSGDNLSDFDYSDVEDLNDSFNISHTMDASVMSNTSMSLSFAANASLGSPHHGDKNNQSPYGDADEDDADEDSVDESGMTVVKIKKIRDPLDITLNDARVSKRQQVMAQEQRRLGIVSPNASFSRSSNGVASPLASNEDSHLFPHTFGNMSQYSDSNSASLQNQVLASDARRLPFTSNTPIPDRMIQVCVKYPLMGVWDEWKDSFQTLSEETELYKSIETWRCPYLLRFYGTHGPGVVFEYVDGDALDEALAAKESETLRQEWLWSELGEHVSTALLYLHKRKISHNDLKPENVRYSKTKGMWKLLDLGLSTNIQACVSKNIGTDGYRAPEVAETGVLTFKSDVFGFGVLMEDALLSLRRRYSTLEKFYEENKQLLGSCAGAVKSADEELEDSILLGGQTWMYVKQMMQDMVTRCLDTKYEARPSITRLVNFCLSLRAKEEEVSKAHQNLLKHYL